MCLITACALMTVVLFLDLTTDVISSPKDYFISSWTVPPSQIQWPPLPIRSQVVTTTGTLLLGLAIIGRQKRLDIIDKSWTSALRLLEQCK